MPLKMITPHEDGILLGMMKAIEATGTVTNDRRLKLQLQLPPEIQPGEHRIVVVIDQRPMVGDTRVPLDFPVDDYGAWPIGLSLRREEFYDDSGR
jgi:hypothetical protein